MKAGRSREGRLPVPRVVLGPCVCQGCGQEVVYEALNELRLGWLHASGHYHCRRSNGPKPATVDNSPRAVDNSWMSAGTTCCGVRR